MRNLISLFLWSAFLFSCTKEFVPPENTEANANLLAIIAPSGNPDHKTGPVQASFLSSNSVFSVASSTLSNLAFPVTFISTAQNNDSIVWIFEGSTASPTTLRGNISSPSSVATQVFYQKLALNLNMKVITVKLIKCIGLLVKHFMNLMRNGAVITALG